MFIILRGFCSVQITSHISYQMKTHKKVEACKGFEEVGGGFGGMGEGGEGGEGGGRLSGVEELVDISPPQIRTD